MYEISDEKIEGIVEFVKYQNSDNEFAIIELMTKDTLITVKGNVYGLNEGENIEVYGNFINHNVYGIQFNATSYIKKIPKTKDEMYNYLISSKMKGIGENTIKKIIKYFDEEIIDIIENKNIERLTQIKGINEEKAISIINNYHNTFYINDLVHFLTENKINSSIALKLYKVHGENVIQKIKKNPYILCNEEIGIDFLDIDNIKENFSIENEDSKRIKSAILYLLKHNTNNGHTCVPENKLIISLSDFLNVSEDIILYCINNLIEENEIYKDNIENKDFLFLKEMYNNERYIASKLASLVLNDKYKEKIHVDKLLENIENKNHLKYNKEQKDFISSVFENNIIILTGGPGTGKTTTINALIEILELNNFDIALCAPTGRAAQRLETVTKRNAKTIHRLLEVEFIDNKNIKFIKNEKNKLKYDIIIIDEISMVDVNLFYHLLKALKNECKLILVGDHNQLPSIGAGDILKNIIESKLIKIIELKKIFRQAKESLIITNSHKIISGEMPTLNIKDSDFFFIEENNKNNVLETTKELYINRLYKAYDFCKKSDIQILTPSRKGEIGTNNINNYIQESINPKSKSKIEVYFNGLVYRENDKVMQIKNNYDIEYEKDGQVLKGIYNGDIGIIQKINLINNTIEINFDGKIVQYTKDMLFQIELAYAITVHKSQGSEFDAVILLIFDNNIHLNYRNLLYTAITRAKKLLIIIGKEKIIRYMINNNKKVLHYTGLKKFLKDELE